MLHIHYQAHSLTHPHRYIHYHTHAHTHIIQSHTHILTIIVSHCYTYTLSHTHKCSFTCTLTLHTVTHTQSLTHTHTHCYALSAASIDFNYCFSQFLGQDVAAFPWLSCVVPEKTWISFFLSKESTAGFYESCLKQNPKPLPPRKKKGLLNPLPLT